MTAVLAVALLLQAAPAPKVAAGEIVEKVVCATNPRFSYALYLPTAFTPEKTWPVLYVFDPRGRGKLAAELFRDGAERRGFILASSNDTESDNPAAPNSEAINALWQDTHARLPLDVKRLYAAGYSGGARLACSLGMGLKGGLAGVVAVGGGFPPERPPERGGVPFVVFGTVGTRDFNYYEMKDLDVRLGKLKVPRRIEIWEGGHDWPPVELAREGVEWLDLEAMKAGLIARDAAFAADFAARDAARAAGLEAEGKKAEALVVYDALSRDVDGLAPTAPFVAAADRLRKSGADAELKRREKLDHRDTAINLKNSGILEAIRSAEDLPPAPRVASDLDVSGLLKLAQEETYEGRSAKRRLNHILAQTAGYMPRELMQRGEYRRAVVALQVAAIIRPDAPGVPFDLARALARSGARHDAVGALERAVSLGLSDRALVEGDPDLQSLRDDAGYQALLARLK